MEIRVRKTLLADLKYLMLNSQHTYFLLSSRFWSNIRTTLCQSGKINFYTIASLYVFIVYSNHMSNIDIYIYIYMLIKNLNLCNS